MTEQRFYTDDGIVHTYHPEHITHTCNASYWALVRGYILHSAVRIPFVDAPVTCLSCLAGEEAVPF